MGRPIISLAVLLLAACSQGVSPTEPEPTETLEWLLANPERLKDLRKQCRINRGELGDALCNIVGEANNKAFLGDGEVPYTPPEEPPAF